MDKLRDLLFSDELPHVAAAFWNSLDTKKLEQLREQGLDIAEILLDKAGVKTAREVAPLVASFASIPTIATVRLKSEGGDWDGKDEERLDIMLEALDYCDAIDVELASSILETVATAAKEKKKTLIVSRHNIIATDTPTVMDENASRAFAAGADIYKTVCLVKNENDFTVLDDFLSRWNKKPVIVIGMGETPIAQKTRRVFPRCGSRIAYAAACGKSAPGQLSLGETVAAIAMDDKTDSRKPMARSAFLRQNESIIRA